MSKKKSQHGGYRPGAGRKATYGERVTPTGITMPPAILTILDGLTGLDKSRSAVVLELLAKAHKPIRDAIEKLTRTV